MGAIRLSEPARAEIEALSRRYLWWPSGAAEGHAPDRMIAQIMRFGTYDDIRRLEGLVSPAVLGEAMRNAAPGWFDTRSWSFWRGRLAASGVAAIAAVPPQRTFARASSL